MFDLIKERIELWRFQRTPLAQAIKAHTQEYFSLPSLASFSQESRERLVGDFCQRISLIYQSENPIVACREALAEYTLLLTQLHVHCLKEFEKAEQHYKNNPYISGQVWRHIRESSDHHEELAQWKSDSPELTDEDLIANANVRSALYLYYANGMNIVRLALGDCTERNWYRPFVEACLVNDEHQVREKLGLPVLVPGIIGSLEYSVFLNFVISGEPDPFSAWQQAFPDTYLAGEGPAPKLAAANL